MTDYKNYRAPRWHDTLVQYAPEAILLCLLLALLLDHFGVWT